MSAVNTIPCPRAWADEHPCGEMTPDGLLCSRCTSALRYGLGKLAELWPELETTRSRQAKTATSTRRSSETPLPFSYDAAWAIDAVTNAVGTWIRDLAERYGEVQVLAPCRCAPPRKPCRGPVVQLEHDPGRTMRDWCAWLTTRMHRIRAHPAVTQLWDELTDSVRLVKRTIDRPVEQTYLCACAICGHPVFGPEGVEEVECRECRKVAGTDGFVPVYARGEAERLRKDATRASHVPAGDLRTAVAYVEGVTVNRKTMHSWITRNRLQAKACRAYHWVQAFADGHLADRLEPSWAADGRCTCKPPQGQCQTLVSHTLLYLVDDAVKLAQDIPLRDRRAEETEQDVELVDHEAAYAKVVRLIGTLEGVA